MKFSTIFNKVGRIAQQTDNSTWRIKAIKQKANFKIFTVTPTAQLLGG